MDIDVVIIGGGVTGTAIAHELARYQLNIVLLEKEDECSFGVSKSNSGIIHTGFQSKKGTLKADLAVQGNRLYEELSVQLQFPLLRVGELVVARPAEKPDILELMNHALELGVPDFGLVDRVWLERHEPTLNNEIEWALWGRSAGVVNPYEVVYAFCESAVQNGVQVRCSEEVVSIFRNFDRWVVVSTGTQYNARCVINAAGLFADQISQLAGIDCPSIFARKGQEFLLDRKVGWVTQRVIFPLPSAQTKGVLVIPTVDHNTMIGPTAEVVQDKYDLSTTAEGKDEVLSAARRLVPSIQQETIIASFSGLRPVIESEDFHIKQDATGFINVLGIQSPGLTAAPAVALYVRNLLPLTLRKKFHYLPERKAIPRFRELDQDTRNSLISADADFGDVICRCEEVTKGEVKESIHRGARTLDGIKFRTRAQMGRCHGAFCTMKLMSIIHHQREVPYSSISKRGAGSELAVSP